MSERPSFLWHDYETTGTDPARDRPTQFAAVRTDEELRPVDEPVLWYCQPSIDVLPHPAAVLITGISPQLCQREGLPEPEFARRIEALFSAAKTCGVGYNSIRFDDEVTRTLLYRNFFDPYSREWRGGNSRWDLLDVLRLAHALRPDGLVWPKREDGATSFRLEALTTANGLAHERAHDALSDVYATIDLARLLRQQQPKLWNHALRLRDKRFAASLLDTVKLTPVVHVSGKISATKGSLSIIAPIAAHPTNSNQVITVDLQQDPSELITLSAEDLAERIFVSDADLPTGMTRIAVKGVHVNKSPMLAPLSTLDASAQTRWDIQLERIHQHHALLLAAKEALVPKLQSLFIQQEMPEQDAELALYSGFASPSDQARCKTVRESVPEALSGHQGQFQDERYNTLLLRYRARHALWTLSDEERSQWQQTVANKLEFDTGIASLTLPNYQATLVQRLPHAQSLKELRLLQELQDWPSDCGLSQLLSDAAAENHP